MKQPKIKTLSNILNKALESIYVEKISVAIKMLTELKVMNAKDCELLFITNVFELDSITINNGVIEIHLSAGERHTKISVLLELSLVNSLRFIANIFGYKELVNYVKYFADSIKNDKVYKISIK